MEHSPGLVVSFCGDIAVSKIISKWMSKTQAEMRYHDNLEIQHILTLQ